MATVAGAAHTSHIRPLALGGVLDEAVAVVHQRFFKLLQISLSILVAPLAAALYFGVQPLQQLLETMLDPAGARPDDVFAVLSQVGAVMLPLMTVAYRIAEPLALGALIFMAAGTMLGRPPSVRESLARSLNRSVPLMITWFIRWLCIQVGTVACYIPGILLAALFFVAMPAIVLEKPARSGIVSLLFNQPFGALGRSIELTKNQFFPAIGLVVVLWLIEASLVGNAQIIPVGFAQALLAALLYSCTIAFYACTSTAFYFSGRCHSENFDLRLMIERASREETPIDPDAPPPQLSFAESPGGWEEDPGDDAASRPTSE